MGSDQFFRIVRKARIGDEALLSSSARFHDDQSGPTSYAAPKLETAWEEVSAASGAARPNPDAFRAIELSLEEVDLLDLTEDPSLSPLMRDPAPPEARELANRLRAEGHDGIIYPSMRAPGQVCVVLFLENLKDRLTVRPVSDDEWEGFHETIG